ncbi:MAG: hypothetical protein VX768_04660 [Planctomycetota bacterium]|nr:hypothetical protein [Planctomycetota bacterium]
MKYKMGELTLSEILDQAFKILKGQFGLLFGVLACLQLPLTLAAAIYVASVMPDLQEFDPENPEAAEQLFKEMVPMFYALGVLGLINLLTFPITQAAMIHGIGKSYLGEKVSIGECYGTAFSCFFPLVVSWILVYFSVLLGCLLCVIPGIIVALWFGLVGPVVVLEKRGGVPALKRSRELMKGNMGLLLGLGVLLWLIQVAVNTPFQLIPNIYAQQVCSALGASIMTIFTSAVSVVFYFSCRSKYESFDVTVLARSFGLEKMTGMGGAVSLDPSQAGNPNLPAPSGFPASGATPDGETTGGTANGNNPYQASQGSDNPYQAPQDPYRG